jgi:hypothetical protein
MPNSDDCVITFPVGGIHGVARLATKLNELLNRGKIGPWHVGRWIGFKHTAIRIKFLTATDGEGRAPFLRRRILSNALRTTSVAAAAHRGFGRACPEVPCARLDAEAAETSCRSRITKKSE